jgi:hypothetical protein
MRPLLLFFLLFLLVILPSFFYLNYSVTQTGEETITLIPESGNNVDRGPVVMPQLKNSTIK